MSVETRIVPNRELSHDNYSYPNAPNDRLAIAWPAFAIGALAIACALALSLCTFAAPHAYAETLATGTAAAAPERQSEIEKLTDEYKAAKAHADAERQKTDENEALIETIEQEEIPEQQKRAETAMVQVYKLNKGSFVIADALLDSESLGDFLMQLDYLEHVNETGLAEIQQMRDLLDELSKARESLEAARDAATAQEDAAFEALHALQQERALKKEADLGFAISVAGYQGEEENKAGDTDDEDADDEAGDEDDEDDGDADDDSDDEADDDEDESDDEDDGEDEAPADEDENSDAKVIVSDDTDGLDDGVDWFVDEDEFMEEWTERIDDYLEGTPLEGQGVHFARSAWRYCVDPRWSPAISYIESSNGAYCIRPHNAWGWGAADSDPYNLASEWDSWEEAIDAHVAGLAEGYGYTLSTSAARTYCPPGWRRWYNTTLGQMESI